MDISKDKTLEVGSSKVKKPLDVSAKKHYMLRVFQQQNHYIPEDIGLHSRRADYRIEIFAKIPHRVILESPVNFSKNNW